MIKAIGDRIVVKRDNASDEVSPGGILLPHGRGIEELLVSGVVLSLGDGLWVNDKYLTPNVGVGDKIYYNKYAPVQIKDGENEVDILPCNEIVCVVVSGEAN